MASFVLTKPHFTHNSVDLSAHIQSISFTPTVDSVEDTSGGDTSRSYLPGLKDATLTVTFNSDPASGATIQSLWASYGTSAAFVLRGSTDSASSSNPEYGGSGFWTSASFVDGSVGDLARNQINFQVTGDVTQSLS